MVIINTNIFSIAICADFCSNMLLPDNTRQYIYRHTSSQTLVKYTEQLDFYFICTLAQKNNKYSISQLQFRQDKYTPFFRY